ncbi:2-C-methyl-D-erythritol 4-phosphate cytidylyltransferase [Culicoidibacter larvae]|uniref:2-C-methyl-D-erythritol 4-phosphate cytidylyltransferase n=1 Tax=Culicoidibacter larvae TaxID=2579976 RepID=A0A5R8QIS9_9FIRM|nr:2-C-methyl-D-erythritol 4-phosphate cytidylyltransferase [Culicoidibacter larvae]TLG77157.1 2-C-methyl-D-erythritol 4-phosphate cytidylyltransferase [Culicoidibacter larvae]
MYDAIILLAGSGQRSGLSYNKVFYEVNEKPLYAYSLDVFLQDKDCKNIIFVCRAEDTDIVLDYFEEQSIDKQKVEFVVGGLTRQESVLNGLKKVKAEFVFIHDGARPCINLELIERMKKELVYEKAVIAGIKATDTLKLIDAFGDVDKTIDREKVVQAQTPQAFNSDLIIKAYEVAASEKFVATDCASVVEYVNSARIEFVEGSRWNIKVTTADDLDVITYLLSKGE